MNPDGLRQKPEASTWRASSTNELRIGRRTSRGGWFPLVCCAAALGGLLLLACGNREKRNSEQPPATTQPGAASTASTDLVIPKTPQDAVLHLTGQGEIPTVPTTLDGSRSRPPFDPSRAVVEVEPNDDPETASPLGADYSAQGQLEGRDKDVYRFSTEGNPQLWTIEARGDNIAKVTYLGSRRSNTSATVSPDDPTLYTLTNLYLLPGDHHVEIRGSTGRGSYTLRAVALGPPAVGMELEPNDVPEQAHRLRFGETRSGHLAETRDRDFYRFDALAEEHVELRWAPPPGVAVKAYVRLAGRPQPVTIDVPEEGGAYRYQAVVPMGRHLIELRAERGRSDQPYAIRLDRLNPFLVPTDREPNDSQHEAAPLPANLVLEGSTRGPSDLDWYRLPRFDVSTSIRIEPGEETLEGFPKRDGLRLYDATGKPADPGLVLDEETSDYRGTLPAGEDLYLRIRGFGDYRYGLTIDGRDPQSTGPPPVVAALQPGPHRIAAFWPKAQRLVLPLVLLNPGEESISLQLDIVSSNHRWRAALDRSSVTLAGGQTLEVPLSVEVGPDAWSTQPVNVTVRARDPSGAVQSLATAFEAVCGAPAVDPQPAHPLPASMLGGLNLAWAALGGRIDGDGKPEILIDGFTPNGIAWTAQLPATVTVDLAGDRAQPITGFLLNPKGAQKELERTREFTIEVSADGSTYREVLVGALGREPYEQAFSLKRAVSARFVRMTIHSNQAGREGKVSLGEFAVVAQPGTIPESSTPLDLGGPLAGGHVVWADPIIHRPHELLTTTAEQPRARIDGLRPFRWVVGFHHGRAAVIDALEWVQPTKTNRFVGVMREIAVAVSLESPSGPWISLGTWQLSNEPGSLSRFELSEPRWARYVRFTHREATRSGAWYLPETLRILEHSQEGDYRSILGEWGQYSRSAAYERSSVRLAKTEGAVEADDQTRATARPLELGAVIHDQVELERDIDWYRIDVPGNHNRLTLDLRGQPDLRVRPELYDPQGSPVTLIETPAEPDPPVFEATVSEGTHHLRVDEPPRSVAFVWDNSGSVGPYRATIYQALTDFAQDIHGSEFANLLPFQGPGGKFLLEDWTNDPHHLQRAVNNYDQRDGSSDAASAIVQATDGLASRVGAKAMLLLTDADFGGYVSNPRVWSQLNQIRPRIFALELHRGKVAAQQDMMQSWAAVNGGHYTYFSTNADLEIAFERARCLLRRPAGYTLSATTGFDDPPAPGLLSVSLAESAQPTRAIELILDASGSMLQRLGSKRRIEIAREVLLELVSEVLPTGTPIALRIFGHREAGSCRSDLEVPLAPLDRQRVAAVIRSTQAKNLAKTPIGASLSLVSDDLKDADGQRVVVLITDGEETCGGDPAGAIAGLQDAGFDVRLNIVGFAIADDRLKATFSRWADTAGGRYFDAADQSALKRSIDDALLPKFQVIDPGGTVVAEGSVGGAPLEVPVGSYSVKALIAPPQTIEAVRIESGTATRLEVAPP